MSRVLLADEPHDLQLAGLLPRVARDEPAVQSPAAVGLVARLGVPCAELVADGGEGLRERPVRLLPLGRLLPRLALLFRSLLRDLPRLDRRGRLHLATLVAGDVREGGGGGVRNDTEGGVLHDGRAFLVLGQLEPLTNRYAGPELVDFRFNP